MSLGEPSTDPLDAFIRPMTGLPAWGVSQGHGSFLTLEFGDPKLEITEWRQGGKMHRSAYVRGQWHLWIYCCHWRASQDGTQIAWSEDGDDLIARAAAALNGQKLLGVTAVPEDGRSRFAFDLGGVLETWPCGPTDEQWIVMSETEAFTFRADGCYARAPSNAPPDIMRWMPLR